MDSPLNDRRVAFVGKLGGLTKREAMQLVREQGGIPLERPQADADLIIIGADHQPDIDPLSLLDDEIRNRCSQGLITVVTETDLWQSLGLVEQTQMVAQLYTPAMMAELLDIPIRNLRRWQNLQLLSPVRVVHRLPYFDLEQVQAARQIANWLERGASLKAIQRLNAELQGNDDRSMTLSTVHVIVEGKQLLVRQDHGLIEPTGQLRIDFDSLDQPHEIDNPILRPPTLLFPSLDTTEEASQPTLEEMQELAAECEDSGQLSDAIEWYRAILARFGLRADINFQLAELLYREGEVLAARERYFVAIELDEDFVEARANLGCVLAETGQLELAIAAFQGALARHDAYPDVHYHLARALDDLERTSEASAHWERFLELAPSSPWAEEAQYRLRS